MKTNVETREAGLQPVVVKRPSAERGRTEIGWLHARHSFSFGDYFDADHMGFRSLRVLNDDVVEPGMGFGMHPHRDAEIFTYIIEGQLQHKDSMGNGAVIKAGDLQYMSAGSGVMHSEFNASHKDPVHLLQVWLKPNVSGGEPRYAEKSLGSSARANALTLLFSGDGRDGSVQIRQDAEVSFGKVEAGKTVSVETAGRAFGYVHVIAGTLEILGETLEAGDAVELSDLAGALPIEAKADAQFLCFSLA